MDKKALTEADIRTKFITPAIVGPDGTKWNVMTQMLEERYFTKGRIIVRGKTIERGEAKKADYILFYKPNIPIAVVEAKDNNHAVGSGMQQALDYAETLDVPFAYSSNGDGFVEHDRTGQADSPERDLALEEFRLPKSSGLVTGDRKATPRSKQQSQRKTTTTTAPENPRATISRSPLIEPWRLSPLAKSVPSS